MEQVSMQQRRLVFLASLLSLLLVSYIDYLTGYEFLFFVFYFVPVALSGWFLGFRTTLALAVLSGLSWLAVDRLSGHFYPYEAFRYWNSFICFVAFAAIGVTLHRLHRALAEQQQAQQQLRQALQELEQSAAEIRKLQSDLQVVCAWTKRIRVNGEWISFDRFLAENLHLNISHGISPEALEEVKRTLEQDKPMSPASPGEPRQTAS